MPLLKLEDLTVAQALRETVGMWRWLAENPTEEKGDWPGLARWDNRPSHTCFLCEVASIEEGGACRACPLYRRWGVRANSKTIRTCTSNGRGLFELWDEAESDEKRSRYAGLLAERATERLAELGEEINND